MAGIKTSKFEVKNYWKEKVKTRSTTIFEITKVVNTNLEFSQTQINKTTIETNLIKADHLTIVRILDTK